MADEFKITSLRHPLYASDSVFDWPRWRAAFQGGERFRDLYLEKFSNRESDADFQRRKCTTPIPAFAKAAVLGIRNAIFQRLNDITRLGGSADYQSAIAGEKGGVNKAGASMNFFLGDKVLTELLVMKQCGIYVDAPRVSTQPSLIEAKGKRPYLYSYPVENILNYAKSDEERPDDFTAVLLQDDVTEFKMGLPIKIAKRFRFVFLGEDGYVRVQFYDDKEREMGPEVRLNLRRIPFHLVDIGQSLIDEASTYQIALLNLVSSDINYALSSNFPFYVEQADNKAFGSHLKEAKTDGSAQAGGQRADDKSISVGPTQGRRYDMGAEKPSFIAPPSETLEVSMALQEKLERDIRKLVNLAVSTMARSAESKEMDNEGLNAGLSFIGLQLENAERQIAEHWAAYENVEEGKRTVASVKYPESWSLKTDAERISQAKDLKEVLMTIPSKTAKKEIAKLTSDTLLGGRVNVATMAKIDSEIDKAQYTTSDPEVVKMAKEAGLADDKTLSESLGYNPELVEQAKKDHADRLARIAESQAEAAESAGDPGARGVKDMSANPNAGREEKAAGRDTTASESTKDPVRGEAE